MSSGTFKIFTIGGIDIKAHWSWLLIVGFFTLQFAGTFFPDLIPGASTFVYLALGLLASLLLFASVLLHELSHSFTAKARGMTVRDITLFIFGGASSLDEEPKTGGDEVLIAIVGPLSSFVIAGVCYLLAQVLQPPVGRVGAVAAGIFAYLALINLMLGIFNMIPGYPLDGGRVLRGIIWAITRNMQSATRIAGVVGQVVAYGFIFVGLYLTFFARDYSGLWLAFIGWFILNAAQQSVASVVIKEATRGVSVGQLMEPAPPAVSPYVTIAHLLTQYVLPYNLRALPVTAGGPLVGIVTLNDIRNIPQEQWGMVTVQQVMTLGDKLRTVTPQDTLEHALEILNTSDFDQLPVVDQQRNLLGMLTRAHITRWLQIRNTLNVPKTTS